MKIALLHFSYCCEAQQDNTKKILQGMQIAYTCGAKWVLTPEMALQGYYMMRSDKPFQLASLKNGVLNSLQAACKKYQQYLFLGCGFVQDNIPHNSCVIIAAKGEYFNRHDKVKVVPWITENWAHPGNDFEVWNIQGLKISALVCADAYFQEHGEKIAQAGAQLALVIAAWPPGGHGGPPENAWKRLSKAAGGIPVIVCNQTGNKGMDCSKAESAVIADGELLFTYEGEEAILLVDFDMNDKKFTATSFDVIPLCDVRRDVK